jgi:hypothetical protein
MPELCPHQPPPNKERKTCISRNEPEMENADITVKRNMRTTISNLQPRIATCRQQMKFHI